MNRFEELANEIIDEVSDAVMELHPELKPKDEDDAGIAEGEAALINGEKYYALESVIADKLQKFKTGRGKS